MDAARLSEDASWANSKPVRLVYLVFERGQLSPIYEPFRRWLRVALDTLPDSRIVEQLHQWLRDLATKRKSDVSSVCSRMNACQTSNVLRSRGIETVCLARDEFAIGVRDGVPLVGLKRKWSSAPRKLPAKYAGIMQPGPTPCKSPTPLSRGCSITLRQTMV
jgi:hypothetical protein